MTAARNHITPRDLEAKMRELQGEVESVGGAAKSYLVVAGAVAVVAVVGVAYLFGRRKGKKARTIVEVKRL
jgi:hypothetical protein